MRGRGRRPPKWCLSRRGTGEARIRPAVHLRAVVGREENEGVLQHAGLVERLHDHADLHVHFAQGVFVGILAGAHAFVVRVGVVVRVDLHEGVFKEEGFVALREFLIFFTLKSVSTLSARAMSSVLLMTETSFSLPSLKPCTRL